MTIVPAPPHVVRRWGLLLGLALLVPQLVLVVLVVRQPIVVGLIGFAMTLGFIRLGVLAHRVLRERVPPVGRGLLVAAGAVAAVLGSTLWSALERAARELGAASAAASADPVYPLPAVGLNLLIVATLGLWLVGVVVALGALAGAVRAYRRPE